MISSPFNNQVPPLLQISNTCTYTVIIMILFVVIQLRLKYGEYNAISESAQQKKVDSRMKSGKLG